MYLWLTTYLKGRKMGRIEENLAESKPWICGRTHPRKAQNKCIGKKTSKLYSLLLMCQIFFLSILSSPNWHIYTFSVFKIYFTCVCPHEHVGRHPRRRERKIQGISWFCRHKYFWATWYGCWDPNSGLLIANRLFSFLEKQVSIL